MAGNRHVTLVTLVTLPYATGIPASDYLHETEVHLPEESQMQFAKIDHLLSVTVKQVY